MNIVLIITNYKYRPRYRQLAHKYYKILRCIYLLLIKAPLSSVFLLVNLYKSIYIVSSNKLRHRFVLDGQYSACYSEINNIVRIGSSPGIFDLSCSCYFGLLPRTGRPGHNVMFPDGWFFRSNLLQCINNISVKRYQNEKQVSAHFRAPDGSQNDT